MTCSVGEHKRLILNTHTHTQQKSNIYIHDSVIQCLEDMKPFLTSENSVVEKIHEHHVPSDV